MCAHAAEGGGPATTAALNVVASAAQFGLLLK